MRLIRGLSQLPEFTSGTVVTIGAFDGVHLGHQALLAALLAQAKQRGLPAVVICFEPLPREFFAVQKAPSRLMNFREKFAALAQLGVDYLLRIPFNHALCSMTAQVFIEQVFAKGLNAQHIIIGDDFRFGYNREGSKAMLAAQAPQYGFDVSDTDSVCHDARRVSSSIIRKALEQGQFEYAQQLLGRPYTMAGRVVYGRQLGRTLGFPTANIQVRRHRSAMSGVYVVSLSLAYGRRLAAVANCGTRPTVDDGIQAVLEVHVFDFNESLYGQQVVVQFHHKLRNEQKFASLPQLQAAIHADAAQARAWFVANPQPWQNN